MAAVHLSRGRGPFECCGRSYWIRDRPGHEGDRWTTNPTSCTCPDIGTRALLEKYLDEIGAPGDNRKHSVDLLQLLERRR